MNGTTQIRSFQHARGGSWKAQTSGLPATVVLHHNPDGEYEYRVPVEDS